MNRVRTPSGRLLGFATLGLLLHAPALAQDRPSPAETRMRACLTAAADAHRLPPAMLVILLKVEGGTLGRVSQNTNDTVDIGPMQVNTIWLPKLAQRWRTSREAALAALRDNLCANLEAGAWILRMALDDAPGDFWRGVGYYHSRTPAYSEPYLRKVLAAALSLHALARKPTDTALASPMQRAGTTAAQPQPLE